MRRLTVLTVLIMASALAAMATQAPRGGAADGIEILSEGAANLFPDGAQFNVFTTSNSNITAVRLRFRVLPDGPQSFARTDCTTGNAVNCTAVVGTGRDDLVPGAEVLYTWEIEDESGQKIETEQKSFIYDDKRFEWESVSAGNLTVYFYFGSANDQQVTLRVAAETLGLVGRLLRTEIDYPVKIWVYATARDLAAAAGGRPVPNGHTLGQVGASDTAIVSRDTDFLDVVRHELAHIVVRRATRSPQPIAGNFTWYDVPRWVNEGLATFAQTRLLRSEEQALAIAIRQDRLLPLSSLSASLGGIQFSLAYSQSGSLVAYLIATYGPEKFADFVAALRRETETGALMSAYGLDQLALENEWRATFDLPAIVPGASASRQLGLPTIVPLGSEGSGQPASQPTTVTGAESQSSDAAAADDGGLPLGLLVAVVIAGLLAIAGGGVYLARGRLRHSLE